MKTLILILLSVQAWANPTGTPKHQSDEGISADVLKAEQVTSTEPADVAKHIPALVQNIERGDSRNKARASVDLARVLGRVRTAKGVPSAISVFDAPTQALLKDRAVPALVRYFPEGTGASSLALLELGPLSAPVVPEFIKWLDKVKNHPRSKTTPSTYYPEHWAVFRLIVDLKDARVVSPLLKALQRLSHSEDRSVMLCTLNGLGETATAAVKPLKKLSTDKKYAKVKDKILCAIDQITRASKVALCTTCIFAPPNY